jgi:hypothetical protein
MKYLNFVAASGRPAREDLVVMQREIPGWEKETQGVRCSAGPLTCRTAHREQLRHTDRCSSIDQTPSGG